MRRRMAREMAMKLIYQMEIQGDASNDLIERFISELPEDKEQISYIRNIAMKYIENRETIDTTIESHAKEWRLNRMAKVDLAILRLAVAEILYQEDIPKSVSINEAIELAKQFSTEHSSSFINGILGSLEEEK